MIRADKFIGQYVPPDQRIEKSIDFRATHFKLGGGGFGEFPRSTNQVNFKTQALDSDSIRPTIDNNSIRRTNFILGQDKFRGQTTTGSVYLGDQKGAVKKSDKTAKDLRNAHFVLGSSPGSYLTEHQHEFYKKQALMNKKQKDDQTQLVGNIRGHHFNFGENRPTYLTTNSAAFNGAQGDGNGLKSPTIGKDLRTAHFDLGKEGSPFVTTSQLDYSKKRGGDRAELNNFNQIGTSFNITGYGSNQKLQGNSLSHTQYQKWPSGQNAKMQVGLKKDLRGSHFILGNPDSTGAMLSQNHGQFVSKRPMSTGLKQKPQLQMNNFSIGDPQKRLGDYDTTYRSVNQPHQLPNKSNSVGKLALKSNLNFGGQNGRGTYQTQNKSNFIPHQHNQASSNKDYLALVKGDHFPSLSDQRGIYSTQNQASFNFKGDPNLIRSTLDQGKKKDLRSSHFDIGSHGGNFSTVHQTTYTKQPHTQSSGLLGNNAAYNLRHKNFKIGLNERLRGQFATEQRDEFRWVQPKAAPKQ